MRALGRGVAGVLAVALLAVGPVPAPAGATGPASRLVTITIPARHAAIPSTWLGYAGPPKANVLLPAGYDPARRYPLLVLLHGLNCNYAWYAQSGLLDAFRGLDAIVVMPEGASGWYADWWNDGQRSAPAWETYELEDVLPAILARYPIRPERQFHAIAGISMGGLGAPYLAGRLPGFFGTVAALSGFTDPSYAAQLTVPAMGLTSFAPLRGDLRASPVEGPPGGFYMQGHDPTQLVENLAHTRIFLSTGTGNSLRGSASDVGASLSEGGIIFPMNRRYRAALEAAGIDVTYRARPGGHDLPTFRGEIDALLDWGLFRPVKSTPRSWANRTVATRGRLWDVGYRFDRPPDRVVELRRRGDVLSVGAAGTGVTITTDGGCLLRSPTPARLRIPVDRCA